MPIKPHGGVLVDRMVREEERPALDKKAQGLPKIALSAQEHSDLELIATGAYSPLRGFMEEEDYQAVVEDQHLASGLPWTLPIVLGVDEKTAQTLSIGDEITLTVGKETTGLLRVTSQWKPDKEREVEQVFGTKDSDHPGVLQVFERSPVLIGGPIKLFRRGAATEWSNFHLEPKETRLLFQLKGWKTVVAFQTRNPIHRAHEYIQKCALECVDGLLLHPLVGATKEDDLAADLRMASYRVILESYFPKNRTVLSVFPAAMRYAGPKEAIFHAIVRKNYGCTHFIVGRDHAGVGSYYGSYDAHHIFHEFEASEIGITPLFFDHAFYCRGCEAMITAKTCPHGEKERVFLSGTRVREILDRGELPPPEVMRPEVARVLHQAYAERAGQGSDGGS